MEQNQKKRSKEISLWQNVLPVEVPIFLKLVWLIEQYL